MNRLVLCQADRGLLDGVSLSTWVTLLARAISSHLEDWAVVIDPMVSAVLYRPDLPPMPLVQQQQIDAIIAEVASVLADSRSPRAVQYLVIRPSRDEVLEEFVGGVRQCFHVVAPIVSFSERFAVPPASMTSWLREDDGRSMAAILLPQEIRGHAGPVSFYPLQDDWHAPDPPGRDSCRLRINSRLLPHAVLEAEWPNVDLSLRLSFERWARTVTCRRVGVTISGGGAAVMRLVPLFQAMENVGVPVDLLSGASGSTAFSACYAIGGIPQVLALAERGLSILITATLTSVVSSSIVQRYIDKFLMDCGVCNTEIRVVPLATSLAPMSPPRPSIIVDGTFGEATRASGGMPFIGPYDVNGVRHVDGSIIAGLPPPLVARQFGANVVFAMNVLAMPENRYPGESNPRFSGPVGLLYKHSILGRAADTISAISTMIHTISEGHGRDADLFIDAPPRNFAIFEPPMLFNSPKYAAAGLGPGIDVDLVAAKCLETWRALP